MALKSCFSNQTLSQSNASQTTVAGQLSDYIKIENDMLKAVNSNDFSSAKKDADDLEHQWDTQEPRLRAIDGNTWTKIEGTIDIVLTSVRSSNRDANKSKSSLNNSLSVINSANK
ncbi:hypothetical protein ACQKMI_11420 [Lysinibacillus sp. NPDC097214]|uniref:hypothetical protein n=1 Tax=Lysinibacillus sp. NPDC097214 TaxID=3390584 RepID=UPI003D028100